MIPASVGVLLGVGAAFSLRKSRLTRALVPSRWPRVSIIVPVLNEEETIGGALASLDALEYPDLEILVVDDGSNDRTMERAQAFIAKQHRKDIRLIDSPGKPPEGWVGKTFAADYAIRQSSGALILVCDADVTHTSASLATAVAYLEKSCAEVLFRIPRFEVASWGEYPLLFHTFLLKLSSFLSLSISRQSFAMGTYLLCTRGFYERSGGWRAHRSFPESLPLLNHALAHHEPHTFLDDDTGEVRTHMYVGGIDTFRGLLRNTNFSLLQPVPLAFFTACAASLGAGLFWALRGSPTGLALLATWMGLFGVYLLLSGYGRREILMGVLVVPCMPVYLLALGLAGLMRQWLPIAITWRGRQMFVQ